MVRKEFTHFQTYDLAFTGVKNSINYVTIPNTASSKLRATSSLEYTCVSIKNKNFYSKISFGA